MRILLSAAQKYKRKKAQIDWPANLQASAPSTLDALLATATARPFDPMLPHVLLDLWDDLPPEVRPADPIHEPLDPLRDLWLAGTYACWEGMFRVHRWGSCPRRWLACRSPDASVVIPARLLASDELHPRHRAVFWEFRVARRVEGVVRA